MLVVSYYGMPGKGVVVTVGNKWFIVVLKVSFYFWISIFGTMVVIIIKSTYHI